MIKPILIAVLALLVADVHAGRNPAKKLPVLDTTYNVLIRCGDVRPDPVTGEDVVLGSMRDKINRPLLDAQGKPRFTGNADFTSYIRNSRGIVSVVQLETVPAVYYAMELEQDKKGHMRVNTLQAVNFSDWEGSVRPCAGSVTPWGSHLGGEESWPDVRRMTTWLNDTAASRAAVSRSSDVIGILNWHGYYLGATPVDSGNATLDEAARVKALADNISLKAAVEAIGATYLAPDEEGIAEWYSYFQFVYKPYMIGFIFEINVETPSKIPIFYKHMAMGRSSFETAYIMPDLVTVYLTDDATSGGLLKFVCSVKGDLSRGTLYAGKFKQTSDDLDEDAHFDVSWIKMAEMDSAIVEEAARQSLIDFNFGNIFISADVVNKSGVFSCPRGYKLINWQAMECLKLNMDTPNVEMLAAGLETRRMIPFVGATSEFTKMEGLTFDEERNKLYMAISFQRENMLPGLPIGPNANDLRLKRNLCGCTYALDVDEHYSAYNMYVQVCGKEVVNSTTGDLITCTLSKPCNVDNLSMVEGYDWLAISEDASFRTQDQFMMHNVETKQNIIVGYAEGGGEVTAGWYNDKIGKYSYITANYQGFLEAPIGYLGPYQLDDLKQFTWKPAKAPRTGSAFRHSYAPFREPRENKKPNKKDNKENKSL